MNNEKSNPFTRVKADPATRRRWLQNLRHDVAILAAGQVGEIEPITPHAQSVLENAASIIGDIADAT